MYLQRMCVRVFLILFSWVAPINIALRIIIIINNYRFCSLYSRIRIRIRILASVFAFVFHLDDVCALRKYLDNFLIVWMQQYIKNNFFSVLIPPSPITDSHCDSDSDSDSDSDLFMGRAEAQHLLWIFKALRTPTVSWLRNVFSIN